VFTTYKTTYSTYSSQTTYSTLYLYLVSVETDTKCLSPQIQSVCRDRHSPNGRIDLFYPNRRIKLSAVRNVEINAEKRSWARRSYKMVWAKNTKEWRTELDCKTDACKRWLLDERIPYVVLGKRIKSPIMAVIMFKSKSGPIGETKYYPWIWPRWWIKLDDICEPRILHTVRFTVDGYKEWEVSDCSPGHGSTTESLLYRLVTQHVSTL